MKAFHVGAANSGASGAFDRIQEILRAPVELSNPETEAVIVKEDGVITNIDKDLMGNQIITVGKTKYKTHKKVLSDFVKVGVSIKKGELLTKEFDDKGNRITIRNPRDVLAYQGPDIAKQYITQTIEEAYRAGDIKGTDRRHYEVATKNMLNRGVIQNPGTSPFHTGQVVPVNVIQRYNKQAGRVVTLPFNFSNRMNIIGAVAAQDYSDQRNPMKVLVHKGDVITEKHWDALQAQNLAQIKVKRQPTEFTQVLRGVNNKSDLSEQNWLDTAAYGDATRNLGEAALLGMTDKLNTPLTRQMTGLKGNFGEGFEEFQNQNTRKNNFLTGFL